MAETPSRSIMLFGTDEPAAKTRLLKAGSLSAELDAGNLRYIRHDGPRGDSRHLLRGARPALGHFQPRNPRPGDRGDRRALHRHLLRQAAAATDNDSTIAHASPATPTGRCASRASGRRRPTSSRTATGFVVLHGVEGISGNPVEVAEVDGRVVETRFPEGHRPGAADHEHSGPDARGSRRVLKVTCTMLGDTFEMEDQRNWTDASYKTYVRPLGLPHPFILKAGRDDRAGGRAELRGDGAAPHGRRRRRHAGGLRHGGRRGRAGTSHRHGSSNGIRPTRRPRAPSSSPALAPRT